nr:MAG TPA: helix-turn-helix domain protein [Caudoviricetes sp.]
MTTTKGLREKRLAAGLSQRQLADIMQVTQGAIANWETGIAYPRASQLPALSKALNCTIDELYSASTGGAN